MSTFHDRLLFADIERFPMQGVFWDPKTRYIGKHNVLDEGYVMCYGYQWYKDRKVTVETAWEHKDKETFVRKAHELLESCYAVVTYNGDKFDLPLLNWEFAENGLTPPMPYASIDLYKVVKANFKLPYYSLDYVCKRFGIGRKLHHEGIDLWLDADRGVEKARKKMVRYNAQDVRLMPRLYKKLLPWIKNHPNPALYMDTDDPVCTRCGSDELVVAKQHYRSPTQLYEQLRCSNCGAWQRGRYTQVPPDKRHTILKGV